METECRAVVTLRTNDNALGWIMNVRNYTGRFSKKKKSILANKTNLLNISARACKGR